MPTPRTRGRLIVADPAHDRLVRRSRVVSYVLVAVGVVALSFAPSLIDGHVGPVVHVLLSVVRPVVAVVCFAAAVGVQLAVGLQWRRRLRDDADVADREARTTPPPPPA